MKFYTNVQCIGNKILLREYDNGQHREVRLDYSPTLFVNRSKSNIPPKHMSLFGENLWPIKQGSIRDAREFLKKYQHIDDIKIYGHTQFVYPYISDTYDIDIEYDTSKINICNIDIEVECELGFPDPVAAIERVNAITMKMNGKYTVLGLGDW